MGMFYSVQKLLKAGDMAFVVTESVVNGLNARLTNLADYNICSEQVLSFIHKRETCPAEKGT